MSNQNTITIPAKDLEFLEEVYNHLDGIGDGAPDASYASKMALGFSQPLKRLIERAKADRVQLELTKANETGSDLEWDETVARLRKEDLIK